MGDPHNPARAGEIWNQEKLNLMNEQICRLSYCVPQIVISGGWAWHYLSPKHKEIKILHDHKDIDMFLEPQYFNDLLSYLQKYDYNRIKTKI